MTVYIDTPSLVRSGLHKPRRNSYFNISAKVNPAVIYMTFLNDILSLTYLSYNNIAHTYLTKWPHTQALKGRGKSLGMSLRG